MQLNLVNDLMDLAKLQQGSFNFNESNFDLLAVIKNAFEILNFQAKEKNIKLILEIMPEDKEYLFKSLMGDKNRYSQIILNFLSNAVKFTNQNGKVTIRINLMDLQKVENDLNKNKVKEKYFLLFNL